MSKEIELMIIGGLLHNENYAKRVMPFVKDVLFEESDIRAVVKTAIDYNEKYGQLPTREAFDVELSQMTGLNEVDFQNTKSSLDLVFREEFSSRLKSQNIEWLLDKTEKYFKDRSCFLAIMESLSIIDGENKKLTRDAIPDILKDALNISFDVDVGHDYIEDCMKRFEFYHTDEARIPFAVSGLNRYTGSGIPRKTLTIPIAPTGCGKSMFLTDWSAFLMTQGYNVLYITLELAEERIAERIDAKLFDVELNDLRTLPESTFKSKLNKIKSNPLGKVIIKEYSPGTFNSNHLRFLLQELKSKRGFKPDVIMVDYLNLMTSYRMKDPGNSYAYIKAITEELRGVAMQHDCVACAPTQTNRGGVGVSDYGLTEISDSFGAAMGADLIFGFISMPDLEKLNQMRLKIMKNRFGTPDASFLVGVNRPKMSFYDVGVETNQVAYSTAKTETKLDTPKKQSLVFEDDGE